MGNILDGAILMIVSIAHFFLDISLVLLELSDGVLFNLFYSFSLTLQFSIQFVHEFTLLF